jgi:ABC-2 type transport system permease protein
MLAKLTYTELKLAIRDKVIILFAVFLPVALLIGFGLQPGSGKPSHDLGGQTGAEFIASIGMGIVLAILGLQALPAVLALYRERGILRRLAVTPVHPARLLTAQLIVNAATAAVAILMLLVIGRLGFGTPVPRSPGWFLLSVLLGLAALFAIGLLIAAVAPGGKAANGLGMILFFPSLFLGGVYIPRESMPSAMRAIGDYTPLGAALKTLRDSWLGHDPRPAQLVIMAVYAVTAGAAATRLFRWE